MKAVKELRLKARTGPLGSFESRIKIVSGWGASSTHAPLELRELFRHRGASARASIVGSTTLLALLVVGITSIALVAAWPHHTQNWANLLGSIAGVLAMVQYLPQIWYTYRLGDIKSLSVITMLIQVPGSFLFAFSLWQRVSWKGWSTWIHAT